MAASFDIEVPRNGSYLEEWRLRVDGVAIDLTDQTIEADCRAVAGTGAVIASATINVLEATEGRFSVQWDGADFSEVAGETEIVRLAYDMVKTDSALVETIIARGHIVLMPGVTA